MHNDCMTIQLKKNNKSNQILRISEKLVWITGSV